MNATTGTNGPGRSNDSSRKWQGPTRDYDLVKEFVIALVAVTVVTALLAALFSSPDEKPITLSSWSQADPSGFMLSAAAELDGTSATATYGPPYTSDTSAAQKIGPLDPQNWPGVTHPIDTANDFVVRPLSGVPGDSDLTAALDAYNSASIGQRQAWASAYDEGLQQAQDNDPALVAAGDYGPVPVMLARLLTMAQSGGLDGALLSEGNVFATDYTMPVLFIADGSYLEEAAIADHLAGDQWGMMNETGDYPGQPWLWLYTFWYQVKPFSTSDNADALVWGLMMVLTLGLLLLPFIPGLRSIPRWVPVYKVIWRDYYRSQRS